MHLPKLAGLMLGAALVLKCECSAASHYDLDPGSADSMNAGIIKLVSVVSPSQIEAWYGEQR